MTTIKEHCCGANLFFDEKTAQRQYKKYLKKGPSRITAKIIQQLEGLAIKGKSMIDVGGGIGALQWWFIENGGKSTSGVDASTGYLKLAKQHANNMKWEDQADFFLGDCVDVYPQLSKADVITLDKVVCCYPNYKDILETTCDKATQAISLSYPMDGFVSSALRAIVDFFMSFGKNPFRPFVHSVKDIRAVVEQKGFKSVAHTLAFPWHIETFVKK